MTSPGGVCRHFPEGILHSAIFFAPLAFGCVEPWSSAILKTLLISLPLVWMFTQEVRPMTPFNHPLVAGMSALAFLAVIQALNPAWIWGPSTWAPFTTSQGGSISKAALYAAFTGLLLAAPVIASDRAARERLIWAVFTVGFLVALIGILHGDQNINRKFYGFREVRHAGFLFAPYYNRNHAAGLMEMSSLAGAGLFWAKFSRLSSAPDLGRRFDAGAAALLIIFMSAVIFAGMMMTQSRAGQAALVIAGAFVALLAVFSTKRVSLRISGLVGIVVVLAGLGWGISNRLEKLRLDGATIRQSASYRKALAAGAFHLAMDFPGTGIGAGGFRAAFPPFQRELLNGIVEHAHNDMLELAAEGGILAVAVACIGFVFSLRLVFSKWLSCQGSDRGLMAGLAGAVLALLLHAFLDFNFQIPANAFIFLLIVALLIPPKATVLAWRFDRRPRLAASLAAVILTGVFVWRPAVASWYLDQARSRPLDEQPPLLRRSLAWAEAPEAHFRLGVTLALLADRDKDGRSERLGMAMVQVDKAMEAEPLNSRYRVFAGAVLAQMGRAVDAKHLSSPTGQ